MSVIFCKVCNWTYKEKNLRVDEKLSRIIKHINEMALEKGSLWYGGDERKIREKHRIALKGCTSIMELIGKDDNEM